MSFYSGIPSELLYAQGAPVTKNTYTTQAVFSANPTSGGAVAIVPANFFSGNPNGVGRTLLLEASGTIATTAAATFNFVLGWDPTINTLGTTLATPWPTPAPTAAPPCAGLLQGAPWATDANMIALGYTAGEVTLLKAAATDIGGTGNSLYRIANGLAFVGSANNFLFNSNQLCGVVGVG